MAELPADIKRSLAQEFFDFLKTFGIIGLAIAFVIGQAASKLVTTLVTDNNSIYWIVPAVWRLESDVIHYSKF